MHTDIDTNLRRDIEDPSILSSVSQSHGKDIAGLRYVYLLTGHRRKVMFVQGGGSQLRQ